MDLVSEWISENYTPLKQAAKKVSGFNKDMCDELLHYTLDYFLARPNVNEIIASGGARYYCVRIMMNSCQSATSPFYQTYLKKTEDLEEAEDVIDEPYVDILPLVVKIEKKLQTLSWYDQKLFDTFVKENHTVSSLARATGIPRTSISLSINRIKKFIKSDLDNGKI